MTESENTGVPTVQKKAAPPPGILPTNAQAWFLGGISLLMVLVILFSGGRDSKRPSTPTPAVSATDPSEARIQEYRARIEEQARRLAAEQAQLAVTKQAVGFPPNVSGAAPIDIRQRMYRGELDTPKTANSMRYAALGDGLSMWLACWLEMLPDRSPEAWIFPSEKGSTPLIRDNCWRWRFLPHLKKVGLEWATFQVMRRTHASLLDELGVDPQVRADQMGHSVDVNQNTYTRSSLDRRRAAVNLLEKAVGVT